MIFVRLPANRQRPQSWIPFAEIHMIIEYSPKDVPLEITLLLRRIRATILFLKGSKTSG